MFTGIIEVVGTLHDLRHERGGATLVVDAAFPSGPLVVGESIAPGKPAAAWFNDAWTYWLAQTPLVGAKLPANLGVRLKVKSATSTGMTIWVDNVK